MKTAKTPTQRWPILAIAEVVQTMGACNLDMMHRYLQGQVLIDKIDQGVAKLVELGRVKLIDGNLVWQADAGSYPLSGEVGEK